MSDFLAELREHSHLADHYERFLEQISASLDARTLNLVQHQVAWVHGLEENPATAATEAESSVLALAEHIPLAYREVSDAMISDLEQHYGASGAVSILVAAAFFDVNVRLDRAAHAD